MDALLSLETQLRFFITFGAQKRHRGVSRRASALVNVPWTQLSADLAVFAPSVGGHHPYSFTLSHVSPRELDGLTCAAGRRWSEASSRAGVAGVTGVSSAF